MKRKHVWRLGGLLLLIALALGCGLWWRGRAVVVRPEQRLDHGATQVKRNRLPQQPSTQMVKKTPPRPGKAVVTKAALAAAPQPHRETTSTLLAYRQAILPPTQKGEAEGELREWLLKPEEGYITHLEEHWRPNGQGELQLVKQREYVANQVLVTLDSTDNLNAFREAMAQHGATVEAPLMELQKGGAIVAVTIPELSFEAAATLQRWVRAWSGKLIPELDPVVTASRIPNDTRYKALWGMEQIQAPAAWELGVVAPDVVVAVLDTGINYHHEDLTENIGRDREKLPFPWVKGYRSIGGRTDGDPMDDNGHGTHCAGTIAGRGDNEKGVAGVTWRTQLMPIKVLNAEGKGAHSDIIRGFVYARDHGATFINCSFGGTGFSGAMETAIYQLEILGVTLACAAGNGDSEGNGIDNDTIPHYPSSYTVENVLAVASSNPLDELSEFSNYGAESVDIAAPGEDIWSTCYSFRQADTCYAMLSGTSMATPHVTGALALLRGRYPEDVYWQTMQRLLLNGDVVEAFQGKLSTGMRLNLYKAMESIIPPAPVVEATEGVYEDRVEITWKPVGGATYYKLYRAWAEEPETKEVLTDWTTDCAYVDRTAALKTGYHYFVQSSKHVDGTNASPYSPAAVGYLLTPILDAWDPKDDHVATATILTPTDEVQTQGPHSLSRWDMEDWYQVEVTAGHTYAFESTGAADLIAELYDGAQTLLLADDDSGAELNFRLQYTPVADGVMRLRVRQVVPARAGYYQLQYGLVGWSDVYDPKDDELEGASVIVPTEVEARHGLHVLSQSDTLDLFKVELEAGVTYTFSTSGDTDTFGELYYDSLAQGNLVAWNDDGHLSSNGTPYNFRMVYTPTTSGTYYVKVRLAASGATTGTYHLLFARQAETLDVGFTDDATCATVKAWEGTQPFVTASPDGVKGAETFTTDETLYLKWAFNEVNHQAIVGAVTNLVEIFDANGVRLIWGHAVAEDVAADEFIDFITTLPALPAGGYVARFTLNQDVDGKAALNEVQRDDNVRTVGFTVLNTADTIVSLEITGASTVVSKGTAQYTCIATFADGTTEIVVPRWCVFEGTAPGEMAADGTLTAGEVRTEQTLRLRATIAGHLAFKVVTIVPQGSVTENPFPEPYLYPSEEMVVKASVTIDGVPAVLGDWVAAYVGSEVRGVAKVTAEGTVTLPVSLSKRGETVTFKVWDASIGDAGEVLACAESLYGVPGYVEEDLALTAMTNDPFGIPVVGGDKSNGWKPGTIYAQVTIDGKPAETGDILAVYAGDRLVGKAMLTQTATLGDNAGVATCVVTVSLSEKAELSFVVWKCREQRRCGSSFLVEMHKNGDVLGSAKNPLLIPANDREQQTLVLEQPGWHAISFSVLPEGATYETIFEPIKGIKDVDPKPEEVVIGKGYWVKTTDHDVTWTVEGRSAPQMEIALAAGWNLIGYTLSRSGRVEDVLREALVDGRITEVSTKHSQWPEGDLTAMHPGSGYWVYAPKACTVKYQSSGLLTAATSASAYGVFGDGSMVVCDPVVPTRYRSVQVWIGSALAAFGDCVALYDSTGAVRAVGRVDSEDGTLTFPLCATAGTVLTAKVWCQQSDTVYAAQANVSLVAPNPGSVVESVILTVADAGVESVTATFDLGAQGKWTGGGMLTQTVAYGGAATVPQFTVAEGYAFDHWSVPYTNLRANTTITAVYRSVNEAASLPEEEPAPPRKVTVRFDANGAQGEMVAEEVNFDKPSETLASNTFEKEGERFIGWATTPDGEVIIRDGASAAEIGAALGAVTGEVPLYAQFAKDGFAIETGTYVLNAGRRVTVPITFESAIPLSCISVRLNYDPKVLALVKVSEGTLTKAFNDDFTVRETELGTVAVALFAQADVIPGKGTVAQLTFIAREGTSDLFSDVTIADVLLAEASGVKNVTVDRKVEVTSGMVRVFRETAFAERLENQQVVMADTILGALTLSKGDAIQASDAQTPVIVTGTVMAAERIPVHAPVNGWAGGRYALLKTPTEGLSFELDGVKEVSFFEERVAGVTTYYAQLPLAQDEIPVLSDDTLTAGACNQIRALLKDQLAGVTEIRITGPKGLVGVIADMGIAPACSTTGSILTAVYTMPTIAVTHFNPKTGLIRIRVKPGEGNVIVSEIAIGYVHVYGSDSLSETMHLLEKIGYDLTPYLKAETKGEAELHVSLGTSSFLKVKVEAEPDVALPKE